MDGNTNYTQNFEVKLLNLDGKVIFKTYNQLLEANLLLNDKLKTLDKGIYLLNITGTKGTHAIKLIKN